MPETRPLYNLPHIAQSDRVIWVEGEKCADELTKLGYTSTCTIGGAGMLSHKTKDKFDFSPLQNKELIIWPDNDESGLKLAKIIQELAQNAGARSITMLVPPKGKPKNGTQQMQSKKALTLPAFLKRQIIKLKKLYLLKIETYSLVNNFKEAHQNKNF